MFARKAYLHLHIKEEVGWGSIYMIWLIKALLWTLAQKLCSIIGIFKYTGQQSLKISNIKCDSAELEKKYIYHHCRPHFLETAHHLGMIPVQT